MKYLCNTFDPKHKDAALYVIRSYDSVDLFASYCNNGHEFGTSSLDVAKLFLYNRHIVACVEDGELINVK